MVGTQPSQFVHNEVVRVSSNAGQQVHVVSLADPLPHYAGKRVWYCFVELFILSSSGRGKLAVL